KIRFSTYRGATRPHPLRARRSGIRDVVFPGPFVVLRIQKVGCVFHARLGVAETSILHFPCHAMVAKVFLRIEPPPGIQSADFESSLAQSLDRHAAPSAGSDHDDIVNLFW